MVMADRFVPESQGPGGQRLVKVGVVAMHSSKARCKRCRAPQQPPLPPHGGLGLRLDVADFSPQGSAVDEGLGYSVGHSRPAKHEPHSGW